MAIYLIGDIQGCCDALQSLLDKIRFDPAADRLWSCGDLVNRGGQSLEVLRLLHSLGERVSVTLGNHDLHLLAENARHPDGASRNREFRAIFAAQDRATLLDWLAAQPLAAWSEKHQLLRIHAGVPPDWSWQDTLARAAEVSQALASEKRDTHLLKLYGGGPRRWDDRFKGNKRLRAITNILTRIRFCDAAGRCDFKLTGPPGSQRKPFLPWYRHRHRQTRDVRIAFGHWAALGFRERKRFIALDSGCVWGGKLTAYRLDDGAVVQVAGRKR
jgi:bis(5'-nucleosyl)-tetraphosphatase (symmetrical)